MKASMLLSWDASSTVGCAEHCLFIFIEWYFAVSDAPRRSFIQLWSSSDMHTAQATISSSYQEDLDMFEIWIHEHMSVVLCRLHLRGQLCGLTPSFQEWEEKKTKVILCSHDANSNYKEVTAQSSHILHLYIVTDPSHDLWHVSLRTEESWK